MKFHDPDDKGSVRTAFHQLATDLQIAIEELDHTLALLGHKLEIVHVRGSDVEIRVTN